MKPERSTQYWKTNVTVIGILLLIWAAVSVGGGVLFIEFFNQFTIGKIPLGFWIANQGAMLTFVVLILVYAVIMDNVDRRYVADARVEKSE